jgi:hypothetical protein
MAQIFGLHPFWLFVVFAVLGVVSQLVGLAALALFSRNAPVPARAIPVPNFAATITTAWALSLGFAAADIWNANSQARLAAGEERSAIARIAGIAGPQMLDRPEMIVSLRAYKDAVREREWGQDRNARPDGEADRAVEAIRTQIVLLALDGMPDSLIAKMTDDFDQLQDARSARLALGQGPRTDYKWYLVIFLTFLSQIALSSVHADRPRGGRRAIAIFTVAAAFSLWILALHANPYVGAARIDFDEVRSLPLPDV